MKLHRPIILVAALFAAAVPAVRAVAQDSRVYAPASYTAEQLDNLVAPIALYPDPILAQVLVAATFPDQIGFAAQYVRANGTRGIDEQTWDVSVKAVAHYPPVLNMLADRPDWATALGQAYAAQSSDVMESVQHLRQMAQAQGNLQSTAQQTVIAEDGNIRIVPAQPQVIYVPTYDPGMIYYNPVMFAGVYGSYWSFGVGFPIGAWLSYDCDWYGRRVYYDGWMGGGWRAAAYPYISINSFYVNPRYRTVYVNHDVWRRPVNFGGFGRYNTVHREVAWNDRGRDNGGRGRGNDGYDRNGYNRDGNRSPGPIQRGIPNGGQGRTESRGQVPGREIAPPRVAEPRVRTVEPSRPAPSWTQQSNIPSRRDQGNRDQGNRNQGNNNGAIDRGARNRNEMIAPPVIVQRPSRPVIERQAPQRQGPPQARSAPPQAQQRSAPPPSRSSAPPSRGSDKKGSSRGGR